MVVHVISVDWRPTPLPLGFAWAPVLARAGEQSSFYAGMLCNAMCSGVSTDIRSSIETPEYCLWCDVDISKFTNVIMLDDNHASEREGDEQVTASDVSSLSLQELDSSPRAEDLGTVCDWQVNTASLIAGVYFTDMD